MLRVCCVTHSHRSGAVEPAEWTTAERLRLNFPPHRAPNNSRLRLACQVGSWRRLAGALRRVLRPPCCAPEAIITAPSTCPGPWPLHAPPQVRCQGDLEVVKYGQFWGEGDEALPPLPPGECWQPLGRLEFVLDPQEGGGGGKAE